MRRAASSLEPGTRFDYETRKHLKGQVGKMENPISGRKCQPRAGSCPGSSCLTARRDKCQVLHQELLAFPVQETHVSPAEPAAGSSRNTSGEAARLNHGWTQRSAIRLHPKRHAAARRWRASPSARVHVHLPVGASSD